MTAPYGRADFKFLWRPTETKRRTLSACMGAPVASATWGVAPGYPAARLRRVGLFGVQLCVEVFAPKVPGRIAQGIALGTMAP